MGDGPRLILKVDVSEKVVQKTVMYEIHYSGWVLHGDFVEPFKPIRPLTVAQAQWLTQLSTMKRIAGAMAYGVYDQTELRREIFSVGNWIDDRWLPSSVKEAISKGTFESLEILSNDPFPPLEIAPTCSPCLSAAIVVSRYPYISRTRADNKYAYPISPTMLIVLGDCAGLSEARPEATGLSELYKRFFGKIPDMKHSASLTSDKLRRLLIEGNDQGQPYNILHFVGHAGIEDNKPWLGLSDREIFAVDDVPPYLTGAPVVFLNGCRAGDPNQARPLKSYEVAAGFAQRFLASGARYFLAPILPVFDETAASFSLEFYEKVFTGSCFGQAVKQIKENQVQSDIIFGVYAGYGQARAHLVDS